ncbi:hypothetical protein ACOSQ2_031831 [Xanthoceras sorbifolium]
MLCRQFHMLEVCMPHHFPFSLFCIFSSQIDSGIFEQMKMLCIMNSILENLAELMKEIRSLRKPAAMPIALSLGKDIFISVNISSRILCLLVDLFSLSTFHKWNDWFYFIDRWNEGFIGFCLFGLTMSKVELIIELLDYKFIYCQSFISSLNWLIRYSILKHSIVTF